MDELLKKLDVFLDQAKQGIDQVQDIESLQGYKVKCLGKKGQLTEILKSLGGLKPDERKKAGAQANTVKTELLKQIEQKESTLKQKAIAERLKAESLDVTLNSLMFPMGSHHPVMQVLHDSKVIFKNLGFDICDGPEIESDYYNFEALNIPANHPARAMQDTFYTDDGHLLRTHTSPVQIRVMEKQKPPIVMVAPGVVYRCDSDQTHTPMFHQIEGLVIDEGINFKHLKAVIQNYLTQIFERDLKFRFRPSFFPFTEPSAEVDMTCVFCNGDGCRVCKQSGWLEIMGCGMVDPAVYQFVDIDADKFSGFAFGGGLERIAMLKYKIDDLRLFFENDLRFLKQF